ncbi:hypothetical protein D3C73_1668770 [compost metagenome]
MAVQAMTIVMETATVIENDILLLRHEFTEANLMSQGLDYETAHKKANEYFNWQSTQD